MLWNTEEIRQMIIERKEEVTSSGAYLTDFTTGMTDNLLPIHYNDIINEWHNMPSEWDESGRDLCNAESKITDRMSADLFHYYLDLVETELDKLLIEWQEEETDN